MKSMKKPIKLLNVKHIKKHVGITDNATYFKEQFNETETTQSRRADFFQMNVLENLIPETSRNQLQDLDKNASSKAQQETN